LTGSDQIGDDGPTLISHHGAERNADHIGLAGAAVAKLAFPMTPGFGTVVGLAVERQQRPYLLRGLEIDVTAGAAGAAVGFATRSALAALERSDAGTAVTAAHHNAGAVDKHEPR
jgi:hypothetical protein